MKWVSAIPSVGAGNCAIGLLLVCAVVAHPIAVAVVARGEPGGGVEDATERARVVVPDPMTDLVDWVVGGLQQTFGLLDAGVLKVCLRAAPGGGLEPSAECPGAERKAGG